MEIKHVFLIIFVTFLINLSSSNLTNDNFCIDKMKAFSKAIGKYYTNAVNDTDMISDDFEFCRKAPQVYDHLMTTYENLKNSTDNAGRSCLQHYIHNNRLDLVQNIYEQALKIWSDAKCEACYSNSTANRTISPDTEKFFNYTEVLKTCIKDQVTDKADNKTICEKCEPHYVNLNQFYEGMAQGVGKLSLCFDVVNSVST